MATEDITLKLALKDEISSGLGNITGGLGKLVGGFVTFEAAKRVFTSFITDVANLQRQTVDLRAAVERAGISWRGSSGQIEEFTNRLQYQKGVMDDYTRESLQLAIDYTKNLAAAEGLVESAADLAAAKHMDLATATNLLGRAFAGHTETLGKYGLTVKKGATELETFRNLQKEIDTRFGGAAAANIDKITVKWELLKDSLQGVNEALGRMVGSDKEGGGLIGNATDSFAFFFRMVGFSIDNTRELWGAFVEEVNKDTDLGTALVAWQRRLMLASEGIVDLHEESAKSTAQLVDVIAHSTRMAEPAMIQYSTSTWALHDAFLAANRTLDDFVRAQRAIMKEGPDMEAQLQAISNAMTVGDDKIVESTYKASTAVSSSWKKSFFEAGKAADNFGDVTQIIAAATAGGLTAAFRGATQSILGSWKWLNEETNGVLKKMAQDFIHFFVNAILESVAGKLVKGIMVFLGSMFDTPANDRMAMKQGEDFGSYFRLGIMRALEIVPDIMTDYATQLAERQRVNRENAARNTFYPGSDPQLYGPGSNGIRREYIPVGGVPSHWVGNGVNITINGNMTPEFIQEHIVKNIQKASAGGFNKIGMAPDFSTGKAVMSLV